MVDNIINDHKNLIDGINRLFDYAKKFPKLISWGKAVYFEHGEFIQWCNYQFLSLEKVRDLILDNYYRESFVILRSIFENYFMLLLAMKAKKYYRYFFVKRGHDINKIYQKWKTYEGKGDILSIEKEENLLKVAYKGLKEQTTNRHMSFYYFLFKDFDPIEAHLGKEKFLIEDYLWKHLKKREKNKIARLNYKKFFTLLRGIIDNLLLNKFINKKQEQRIKVHYNFLSLFTHPNRIYVEILQDRTVGSLSSYIEEKKYNFYLTRLGLLYVGYLVSMFLKLLNDYFVEQRENNYIEGIENKELLEAIKKFESENDYFWFIFNKPHYFYKEKYCKYRSWKSMLTKKQLKQVNASEIPDYKVPYYKNPYEILKEILNFKRNG